MKKSNYLVTGVVAVMAIFMFVQCTGNSGQSAPTGAASESQGTANIKIAFVELDSLLLKYNFWNDVNEEMIQRGENVRATLTQKSRDLEREAQEFQRKYETNAFVSQERAQQEYARINKKQQDLQALQTRLADEMVKEQSKNDMIVRDSINSFLKEYNKTKGYSLIISTTGFDNLLYADPVYNITQEIVNGLNERYTATVKD
ncbi:MAG: OmpH family outer membrane protein [Mediterranea sp.]|nr:OmpH family outer membrane protein [Mediterranea sp.]